MKLSECKHVRECCEALIFFCISMSHAGNGSESTGSVNANPDILVAIQAMQREFSRMSMRLDNMQERLEENENRRRVLGNERRQEQPRAQPRVGEEHFNGIEEDSDNDYIDMGRHGQRGGRRGRPQRGLRNEEGVDRNLGSIKMSIPSFQGKSDPDAYLDWERKVEKVFDCHNYSEQKTVKLAITEFTDYASTWWDKIVVNRRKNLERPVSSWEEMKAIMRKRFVPSHYYRDFHRKLQTLYQGTKGVEEYYQEMEMSMIRANIEEDREATMQRFINGLNREIANVANLQHYVEMEELVHMAIKVKGSSSSRVETNSLFLVQVGKNRRIQATLLGGEIGVSQEMIELSKGLKKTKSRKTKLKVLVHSLLILETEILNVLNVMGLGILLLNVLIEGQ